MLKKDIVDPGEFDDSSDEQVNDSNDGPETVIKEGWLRKEGNNQKPWKDRWFVLTSTSLSYWESQKAIKYTEKGNGRKEILKFSSAKGRIPIDSISSFDGPLEYCKFPYTLLIHDPKRTYYITYSKSHNTTYLDLDEWIKIIGETLVATKEKKGIPQGLKKSLSSAKLVGSLVNSSDTPKPVDKRALSPPSSPRGANKRTLSPPSSPRGATNTSSSSPPNSPSKVASKRY